jgi:hypothetical protein
MATDHDKIELIQRFILEFNEIAETHPGMLGPAEVLDANFQIIDELNFIVQHGKRIDHRLKWHEFLIKRRIIVGSGHDYLQRLRSNPDEYSELIALRRDYGVWLANQLEALRR